MLAAVENAQHQHRAAVVAVLESVGATHDRQHDFTVFVAISEWASQPRMATEHISPFDPLASDAGCGFWEPVVQESGESTEIGKRVDRPLDLYWPGHGRNPGRPHVRSHCTTRS